MSSNLAIAEAYGTPFKTNRIRYRLEDEAVKNPEEGITNDPEITKEIAAALKNCHCDEEIGRYMYKIDSYELQMPDSWTKKGNLRYFGKVDWWYSNRRYMDMIDSPYCRGYMKLSEPDISSFILNIFHKDLKDAIPSNYEDIYYEKKEVVKKVRTSRVWL